MGRAHFFHPSTGASSTYWRDPWVNGGKGVKNRYIGLKFKINGKFHFGWARITVITSKGSFTSILTGFAYETIADKSIIAGETKGTDDSGIEQSNPAALALPG